MAVRVRVDETTCSALCQHPQCWLSQKRQDQGLPRMEPRPLTPPDIELDLPTLKVCNMLADYGDDDRDLFPARFAGKASHTRNELLPNLSKPVRTQSVKLTRAPQPSPKSSTNVLNTAGQSAFKVVEVQEVFDRQDLKGTWDDTFVPKSYYVWVPNMKKKKRKKKKKLAQSEDISIKAGTQKVKDMTEEMVPQEIEDMRLYTARKKRAKSPAFNIRQYTMSPPLGSSRMDFDYDGITELLDLPREILVQVLENTRQSDLMSRDKIREIIRRFMPTLERGNTNISLASQDLLQQKKLNLHEGNKNVRQPHLMETKPVFYMDDDVVDDDEIEDEDIQRPVSPYGSLKDLYFGGNGTSREVHKFKKPLPAIFGAVGRAVSAGQELTNTKIPSISLGLPELPSGIKHTKAFTYNKKSQFDFTLGPVPTPPTSVRSTGTGGSDHGTTIRVNVPSENSDAEHNTNALERRGSSARATPDPMHAVSPTFSTRVPKAPATTPATNHLSSPTKSAPLLRDMTGSSMMMTMTPQEWPPRDKLSSPTNMIMRAPVNTPGSVTMMQENSALRTIHEGGVQDNGENGDQPQPMSRGRSVRFEIPEVPPPPSSPQLSDEGIHKDPSRNTVTVNTSVPQETPSTGDSTNKPMSGTTIKTDANTINTSNINPENSFIRSQPPPTRDLSFATSPEPWPQINEADYEAGPIPTPNTMVLDSPATLTTDQGESRSDIKSLKSTDFDAQSKPEREPVIVPSPDRIDGAEYGNNGQAESNKIKKLMEDSRKSESPAPPPPSPEPKLDKKSALMTPLMEETETPHVDVDESEMTVLQVAPKGNGTRGQKKVYNRQIDTFQNIDIPASMDGQVQPEVVPAPPVQQKLPEPPPETILEEPEPDREPTEENKETRDVALSAQSTLANRTISEHAQSDISSSVVEPAISQASQAPALSEDFNERKEHSGLLADWTGVIVGSDGRPDTTGMISDDKLEMTEDGGDHEGFKDDLREEYEKMQREIDDREDEKEGEIESSEVDNNAETNETGQVENNAEIDQNDDQKAEIDHNAKIEQNDDIEQNDEIEQNAEIEQNDKIDNSEADKHDNTVENEVTTDRKE